MSGWCSAYSPTRSGCSLSVLSDMLAFAADAPADFAAAASELFRAMRDRGGRVGFWPVPWFNGRLFDDAAALPLEGPDVALLARAAALDWAEVDPSIYSRFHEAWSLATCSWHGVGNDPTYNGESCFETFPFPDGLTPNVPAATYTDNPHAQSIAAAARALVEARDRWLNPPDLVERVPEVVPGFPDRLVPRDAAAAASKLKRRTLTALYNARGTPEGAWLDTLHRALDEAVAAAYAGPPASRPRTRSRASWP